MKTQLDALIVDMFSGPVRGAVKLADGEEAGWWCGMPPPPGHRWETDAEFRARIKDAMSKRNPC